MDSLTLSTGGTALVTALLLQYLKKANWFKFLGIEQKYEKINFAASVIAAGLTSVGVGYTYDHSNGNFALIFSTHQMWHWFVQWAAQHAWYKTAVVPTELLAGILNELKQNQTAKTN